MFKNTHENNYKHSTWKTIPDQRNYCVPSSHNFTQITYQLKTFLRRLLYIFLHFLSVLRINLIFKTKITTKTVNYLYRMQLFNVVLNIRNRFIQFSVIQTFITLWLYQYKLGRYVIWFLKFWNVWTIGRYY